MAPTPESPTRDTTAIQEQSTPENAAALATPKHVPATATPPVPGLAPARGADEPVTSSCEETPAPRASLQIPKAEPHIPSDHVLPHHARANAALDNQNIPLA